MTDPSPMRTAEQQQQLVEFIQTTLQAALPTDKAKNWLASKLQQVAQANDSKAFFMAFSMAPRKVPTTPLDLSTYANNQLNQWHPGFDASKWTYDQLCRVALMLQLPQSQNQAYLDRLFGMADLRELVSLYSGLYLLPNAGSFANRAAEGVRTNMADVFDAIALNNPYPAQYLDEGAWNQMVLKAIFMERPVYRIYHLEQRRNATLAKAAADYAHERWAAGRAVTPELWRLVVPFIDEALLQDLQQAAQKGTPIEQQAAARAAIESNHPPAHNWAKAQGWQLNTIPSWAAIGHIKAHAHTN